MSVCLSLSVSLELSLSRTLERTLERTLTLELSTSLSILSISLSLSCLCFCHISSLASRLPPASSTLTLISVDTFNDYASKHDQTRVKHTLLTKNEDDVRPFTATPSPFITAGERTMRIITLYWANAKACRVAQGSENDKTQVQDASAAHKEWYQQTGLEQLFLALFPEAASEYHTAVSHYLHAEQSERTGMIATDYTNSMMALKNKLMNFVRQHENSIE
jgi:hypothetical protein